MSLHTLDIYFDISNKDQLVDLLLEEGYNDFYFFPCKRYGAEALLTNSQEQVSARRDFALFRLMIHDSEATVLATAIKEELKDKTIKIFVYEVMEL